MDFGNKRIVSVLDLSLKAIARANTQVRPYKLSPGATLRIRPF